MSLCPWCLFRHWDLYGVLEIPQTYQPDGVLRVMGKHPLQCLHTHLLVRYSSWPGIYHVSDTGFFDPDVSRFNPLIHNR